MGGAEVSEANGVLRNHYYSPGVTIYIEKRLTNQSFDFLVSLFLVPGIYFQIEAFKVVYDHVA